MGKDHPQSQLPPPGEPNRRVEFERAFREHNDALLSYVYARVHSWAEAKEIVQEAYCRIFALGERQIISHLRAYLYQTAGNITRDRLRMQSVRERFAGLEVFSPVDDEATPEKLYLLREELAVIQRAIERLPPKCRLAMILMKYRGLSYEEAGRRMGIKTHSVRRLVERALEHLRLAVESGRQARKERKS